MLDNGGEMESNYVLKVHCEEHGKRIEDEQKRQNKMIDKIEKQCEANQKLLISIEKLALAVEGIQNQLEDHGDRLKTIESRDGESWSKLKWVLITAIVSLGCGVIGYCINNIII